MYLSRLSSFALFQKHLDSHSQVQSVVGRSGAILGALPKACLYFNVSDDSVVSSPQSGEHIESFLDDTAEQHKRTYVYKFVQLGACSAPL